MNEIIVLNISEQSPNEIDSRLNRTGQLSLELAGSGYKVIWIGSSFSHQTKRYLKENEKKDLPNLKFFFLKSLSYKKNISIIRVINNFFLAIQALSLLLYQTRPKMVYCYTPPIEVAFVSAIYSKFFKIPYMIDVRDNWPDSFEHLFPSFLQPLTKILFFPWRWMLSYIFSQANKITASSMQQADFAKKYTKDPFKESKVFYIGDDVPRMNIEPKNSESIELLFIGTLTNARPLFSTIRNLNDLKNQNICLSVIGDGDNLEIYKDLAKFNEKIRFFGRKTGHDLFKFVQNSDILIAPYEKAGYGWSMPAKISSYIGFGRPIITNIGNETKEFLENYALGSVIDFEDGNQFLNAIQEWSKVDKEKYYNNARIVYEENFDMKKIAKSMLEYILED